jgi:formate-dependent nitrite reductase membrane component NrfD
MSDPAKQTREMREQRLLDIRREAQRSNVVGSSGNEAPLSGASAQTGYYGTPLLKKPQWTVEVPIYFFVGGVAGAASVIAAVGALSSADQKLIRQARWLAAIGGAISPALLISDLGMPSRFLNMLRVFKIQSAMSVGSWTLVAFSNSAAATAVLGEIKKRRPGRPISVLTNTAQIVSTLTGLVLATYTGVLIGATAIPAWHEHVGTLPLHFGASGTSAAASILELAGNKSEALNRIAIGATAVETYMGAAIELGSTPGTEPLRSGSSGRAMRVAGVLSGPIPLALRLLSLRGNGSKRGLRRAAAISSVVGSLITRWAWLNAGTASAKDSSVPLQLESPKSRDSI